MADGQFVPEPDLFVAVPPEHVVTHEGTVSVSLDFCVAVVTMLERLERLPASAFPPED